MEFASSSHPVPVQSVPLLDVKRGNQPLLDPIMQTLREICESGWFIGGPHCQNLEALVAENCDTELAVGCASGSDALLLALMALDIKRGDEVIVPSFTFFASVSAITRLGATPVFVDIDPRTFNMNPALLPDLITESTRAIMPVHLFGRCADMMAINEIARQHDLRVIEDAAQSIGASYEGRRACSMGDVGCLSFYPTKNLGGFGDAGMVATNNGELAARIRRLANHGMEPRYYHSEVGINSRLDAMQAAILGIKMAQLQRYSVMRQRNANTYRKLLVARGLASYLCVPEDDAHCDHVWNQFTIRIPDGRRDEIRQQLADRGIGSEIYYPVPMHQQECFARLGYHTGSLPETERAAGEVLSLPIFPELTTAEIQYVVDGLTEALSAGQDYSRRLAS